MLKILILGISAIYLMTVGKKKFFYQNNFQKRFRLSNQINEIYSKSIFEIFKDVIFNNFFLYNKMNFAFKLNASI